MENILHGSKQAVKAVNDKGEEISFEVISRLNTPVDIDYFRNGEILHTVLRRMLKSI